MLEGFFYSGEVPSTATLSDMLINVVVAAECNTDLQDGAEQLVAGLVKAWRGAKEHENQDDEDFDLELISDSEAEKIYGNTYRKVYCQRLYNRAPNDSDEIGWWPDCMDIRQPVPRKLLVKVARTLAAVEADHARALFRYMEQQNQQRKQAE